MTLPLSPTLADVRNSVAIRCGLATSGTLANNLRAVIDEMVRKCQAQIYLRATWARQVFEQTITAVNGERDYDIPSVTTIGGILRVAAVDSKGKFKAMAYDDLLDIENITYTPGKPEFWKIIDDMLRVKPAPDTTEYPSFLLLLYRAPASMVADADRTVVDGEALIQLATIGVKEYLGVGGDQRVARAEFERYLLDLRQSVSPPRMFLIATRRLDGPAYWTWPTVDAATMPYAVDWNPPGVW